MMIGMMLVDPTVMACLVTVINVVMKERTCLLSYTSSSHGAYCSLQFAVCVVVCAA